MIFGSVCSGIEAASVAWRPLGWKAAFLSEIEAFPRAVLKHRQPDAPLHGDFTTIKAGDYAAINVLVGGTPCQSFSVAGLRGGLADERGNLALEYLRLAQRLRPRWLVWENVPGVLSSNGGRDFGAILGGMVELGYGVAYRVLDAQFFGVPQRRRRVFAVGYLGDWRRAAAVLFEPASLRGDPAPSREARERVAATISASSGGCSGKDDPGGRMIAPPITSNPYGDHERREGLLVAFGGNNTGGSIDIATAVRAKGGSGHGDFESETFVAHALRGEGFDASEDGTGRGTPLVPITFDCKAGANTGFAIGETPTALRGEGHGGGHVAICFSSKDHGADAEYDMSPTLRAGAHDGSHANAGVPPAIAFDLRGRECGAMPESAGETAAMRAASGGSSRSYVAEGIDCFNGAMTGESSPTVRAGNGNALGGVPAVMSQAVRRLTPRECERLQGFPDDYTLIPWRGGMASDGPRYKALGNSMAVPVMRWIGERIAKADAP